VEPCSGGVKGEMMVSENGFREGDLGQFISLFISFIQKWLKATALCQGQGEILALKA
jgi:hypothetical protein